MMPQPGVSCRNSSNAPRPSSRRRWPAMHLEMQIRRAKPVMKIRGSRRASCLTMSSRTVGVAVAVRAIVGGFPSRRRNSPKRA